MDIAVDPPNLIQFRPLRRQEIPQKRTLRLILPVNVRFNRARVDKVCNQVVPLKVVRLDRNQLLSRPHQRDVENRRPSLFRIPLNVRHVGAE
jgi:hypothetical protein